MGVSTLRRSRGPFLGPGDSRTANNSLSPRPRYRRVTLLRETLRAEKTGGHSGEPNPRKSPRAPTLRGACGTSPTGAEDVTTRLVKVHPAEQEPRQNKNDGGIPRRGVSPPTTGKNRRLPPQTIGGGGKIPSSVQERRRDKAANVTGSTPVQGNTVHNLLLAGRPTAHIRMATWTHQTGGTGTTSVAHRTTTTHEEQTKGPIGTRSQRHTVPE